MSQEVETQAQLASSYENSSETNLEDAEGFGRWATVFVSEMRSYLFPQVQPNQAFTAGMRRWAKISMRLV
ncbi:uncharacterized protein LOC117238248 [Bombus vosnesenskii]|uniref:Uncharacterized protein LOC117238248 n=1 Tax=Bombus vosnesenskii TaxID=207650 RepID=A0A6J3L370_9HYME|nr:uncharacterized protein LOC117238248 [Bombus vosnesenskii]